MKHIHHIEEWIRSARNLKIIIENVRLLNKGHVYHTLNTVKFSLLHFDKNGFRMKSVLNSISIPHNSKQSSLWWGRGTLLYLLLKYISVYSVDGWLGRQHPRQDNAFLKAIFISATPSTLLKHYVEFRSYGFFFLLFLILLSE